jgi:hypothetical protein
MGSSISSNRKLERLKQLQIEHKRLKQAQDDEYSIKDGNDDPMLAAANKLSLQFDHDHAASMYSAASGDPTIINKNNLLASNASTPSTTTDRFIAMFPEVTLPADYLSTSSSKDLLLEAFIQNTTDVDKRRERDR